MKKTLLTIIASAGLAVSAFSQAFFEAVTFTGAFPPTGTSYTAKIEGGFTETFSTGDWTEGWTNWYPNAEAYPAPDANNVLTGDVSSDLSVSGNVSLQGTVHVKNGATLTFAAGTVVRAGLGATLIISKGAKINAVGTKTNPIVFTSDKAPGQRQPGDWAGILIIGNSQVNTASGKRQYEALPSDPLAEYGGGRGSELNLADNSGEMRFVRIEFAGYNYLPDQEINGLTFGAVGSGTRVNFVQVSFARDDSFEWFGGTSNHKYLIAYSGVDDDFDMDEGYAGYNQFILGVRNPFVYETAAGGTSNGFEHDNNTGLGSASAVVPGVDDPKPNTSPFISNATMIGPWATRTVISGNKFGRGMEMRSGVATSVYNSIVIGYNSLSQLVHPTPTITPSTGIKLLKAQNDVSVSAFDVTPCEYVNTHLVAVNTASGFAYATASNQPTPSINFSSYMNGTNSNSFINGVVATDIFENVVSNFATPTSGISYSPKTTSFLAGVPSVFTGLIADKTASPDDLVLNPSGYVDRSSLSFGTKEVGSETSVLVFGIQALNLTSSGVSISSSSSDFVVNISNLTLAGGNATSPISVSFVRSTAGTSSGTITINFNDSRVSNIVLQVSGTLISPSAPILNLSAGSLSFTTLELEASSLYTSAVQSVDISGRNIANNVTITAPSAYLISTSGSSLGNTIVLTPSSNGILTGSVDVILNSTVQSSSNSGNLVITDGVISKNISLSANTNPVFTVATSANIDRPAGVVISTVGAGFNVRGDRLPSSILLTPNTPNIEVSVVSATAGYGATAILTTNGRITSTGVNVWARFIGSVSPSTAGTQVGTISVSGFTQVVPVSVRQNDPGAIINRFILADASSRELTALGFNFNGVLRGTPYLYSESSSALIGQVSVLGTNTLTLRSNSLISTTNVAPATFVGTIMADITSAEITGTGTSFTSLPVGLPIHLSDGTLIGKIASVSTATLLTLEENALVSADGVAFRTSAIRYRRSPATISVSVPSPLALSISSFTDGVPNPVVAVITLTGDNHDGPVTLRINPVLSASGYMFELSPGVVDASTQGMFNITVPVSANGQLNQAVTVRYNPQNIATLSLPGVNVKAAHSTELLIFRTGQSSQSSNDPRGTIAYNLRGSAFPNVSVSKTSLAKFSTYKGLKSPAQSFVVTASRTTTPVSITSPNNFEISLNSDFSNSASVLTTTSTVTVYVRYSKATVGSDNGSISVAANGIATLNVNVSGEAVGFNTFVNATTENNSNIVSFVGTTMVNVSGSDLISNLTVTSSANFLLTQTLSDTTGGVSSIFLEPSPSDLGDVSSTSINVNYTGGTVVGTGTITIASKGATPVIINVVGGVIDIVPIITVSSSPILPQESKISVYPNPTEDYATLEVELSGADKINVDVYDMTGSVVASFFDNVVTTSQYPITGLTKGIYFVRVATSYSVKTVKLVVK